VRLRKSVPKSEQQHTQWQQRAEEDVAKPKSSDGKNLDMENKYKNKAVVLETVVDIFREPDINSERVTQAISTSLLK